jgi:hypothetical protein
MRSGHVGCVRRRAAALSSVAKWADFPLRTSWRRAAAATKGWRLQLCSVLCVHLLVCMRTSLNACGRFKSVRVLRKAMVCRREQCLETVLAQWRWLQCFLANAVVWRACCTQHGAQSVPSMPPTVSQGASCITPPTQQLHLTHFATAPGTCLLCSASLLTALSTSCVST